MSSQPLTVTYLIGAYPNLTTTFIDREITVLRQMGVRLRVLSIRRPWTQLSAEQRALQEGVRYLLPVRWQALLWGHLRFAVRHPKRYFGTLAFLLTRPHPGWKARLMTLLHFGEGVYAAHLLKNQPGDHLHAHFIDRAATIALVAGRLLGIPYSVTAHANDIYVNPLLLPEKCSRAAFVATCSAMNRAYLKRAGLGRFDHKLLLLYHGIDPRRYQRSTPPPDGQVVILAVGQLKARKGFTDLLQACRILQEQQVDFTCRIVGEGPQRTELEAQIAALGLAGRVQLCGAMPQEAVIEQYEQAAIFALPVTLGSEGDRDGIPNVILEALAMEVPVVSTRYAGVPEVIEDGVNGLLAAPGDVRALAAALGRLVQQPALRRQLAAAGRQRVIAQFNPESNARQLLEAFQQVQGQKSK